MKKEDDMKAASAESNVVVLTRGKQEAPPSMPGDPCASDLVRIGRFLRRLMEAGYYGKITFSLQNGKLVECRTEQTMKVDEI